MSINFCHECEKYIRPIVKKNIIKTKDNEYLQEDEYCPICNIHLVNNSILESLINKWQS